MPRRVLRRGMDREEALGTRGLRVLRGGRLLGAGGQTQKRRDTMSETTSAPTGASTLQVMPGLVMNMQFIKDLSFEVPGAPQIFSTLKGAPNISLNLDVGVQRLDEKAPVFEVTLSIRTEATEARAGDPGAGAAPAPDKTPAGAANTDGRRVFIAELAYSGVVTLNGVASEHVEPILLVEVPRLLFPYARNILADVTRDGGFPPVLLQPIDFVNLWQQRRAQAQAAQNIPAGHA